MKKIWLLSVILLGFVASCDEPDYVTINSVNIFPPGGYAVESLTASINASASGSNLVRVDWKWHAEGSTNSRTVKSEYLTIDHDGTYTSTYYASSGYVLLNYYWAELYDEYGRFLASTAEVYCYYY